VTGETQGNHPGGSSAKVFKAGEKFKIKDKEVDLLDYPTILTR